jgi:uncharacterized small protein (TIGR04563 family)
VRRCKPRSFYLPTPILDEVLAEAKRLERTPSWILIRAWQIAKASMKAEPSSVESDGE